MCKKQCLMMLLPFLMLLANCASISRDPAKAEYPVLTQEEWRDVFQGDDAPNSKAAQSFFYAGSLRHAGDHANDNGLATILYAAELWQVGRDFLEQQGNRNWIIGYFLRGYAHGLYEEAIANEKIRMEPDIYRKFLSQHKALLDDRAAKVESDGLTMRVLERNFRNMNAALERLNRPKGVSLSIE